MELKTILWGSAALMAATSVVKLSQLNSLGKEFVIETSSRIHNVNATELVVAIDIVFKNPTSASIQLKQPFVSLFDSPESLALNKPLRSSEESGQFYTIAANGQTKLAPVYIRIPLSVSLLLTAVDWLKTYLRGEPVHLIGRATTTVNAVRVEKLMPVTIQKAPPVSLFVAGTTYATAMGVTLKAKLVATNKQKQAQPLTSIRLAVYATNSDRSVDAPLWTQVINPTSIPGNATLTLGTGEGLLKASQLAHYPNLKSVLLEATVMTGNRTAQTLIDVNLPS